VLKSETLDRYAATWKSTAYLSHPPSAVRGGAGGTDLPPLPTPRRARLFHPAYLGAVEKLHAVESEHADSDLQSCDGEETPPAIQAAYEQLDTAVGRCSVQLIRQLYGEQVFRGPVVEFCALYAMTDVVHPLPQRGHPLHAALATLPLL
jgi:hypothetical protein